MSMTDIMAMQHNAQLADIVSYINTPTGFSWSNSPVDGKIWKDKSGVYHTSYDVATKQKRGKIYYVDQTNGNDTNDGLTVVTSLKSMLAAYNKTDIDVMVLCSRKLYYNYGLNGTQLNKDITIKTLYGTRAIITNHSSLTWTKTGGLTNVYQATCANASIVVDVSRKDSYGDYLALTSVASSATCDSTVDSYYISGSTVYAHITGNGSPGFDVFVLRSDVNTVECNFTTAHSLYLENVDILGGFSVSGSGNVYAKNCCFEYGRLADSHHIEGEFTSIMQNCIASRGYNDGFSYHANAKGIEINCVGRNNGYSGGGTDNGSTSHAGCKVIRINGQYFNNSGPNVVDVQDSTESWNMGCTSYNSLATSFQKSDYQAQQGNVKMFMDGCKTQLGSLYSTRVADTAKMFVRNCSFETYSIADTATIEEY